MKVIELSPDKQQKLEEFAKDIIAEPTRPAIYIGFDRDGQPVLHLADMSWKELAYVKTAFDMHVTRNWLDLPL